MRRNIDVSFIELKKLNQKEKAVSDKDFHDAGMYQDSITMKEVYRTGTWKSSSTDRDAKESISPLSF